MIDHLLGRPDSRYRKYQVVAIIFAWLGYIYTRPHGPKPFSRWLRYFDRRVTLWQCIVLTCLTEYIRRNFKRLIPWLESPEPMANMYSRDYFRATWVTTALDAGFWSAMRIKPRWLREVASIAFTGYYLISAEAADDMVRRVRSRISVEHLRVSWNKGATPLLAAITNTMRPRHLRMRYLPRRIRIPRPDESKRRDPISAWLYFDGALTELKDHDKIILDIPGGGFVAMDPRCHDDKLMAWARKTGFPIVAIDYKKAPEYPYPYALNECFDAYHQIIASRGKLVGLPGDTAPRVILSGDSAGGNIACGVVLMILQAQSGVDDYINHQRRPATLPLPEALVLVYPALDINFQSWLTDDQSALIKDPTRRQINEGVVRRKTEDYHAIVNTPMPSDDEGDDEGLKMTPLKRDKSPMKMDGDIESQIPNGTLHKSRSTTHKDSKTSVIDFSKPQRTLSVPRPFTTRLEMSSMISYVDDRILSPAMLRAMIVLYVGPNKRPDFSTEFLLSPLRAPEELLRHFPKVYMMTGERDPLNDDTVLFAGRLLEAHLHRFQELKEKGIIPSTQEFNDEDYVHCNLIQGVSHGFLQFASVYSKGFELIELCSRWMKEAFQEGDKKRRHAPYPHKLDLRRNSSSFLASRDESKDGVDDEDAPLELSTRSSVPRPSSSTKLSTGSSGPSSTDRRDASGRGKIKKPAFSGRKSPVQTRNDLSKLNMTSLSEQAFLLRRMDEVVRGLAGEETRPKTPT